MVIKSIVWPMVIVGLPNVNIVEYKLNKLDYTIPSYTCEKTKLNYTLEHNYITTEQYLESFIEKYQDVIP